MAEPMNEVERRVLGVLLEKALAQPQYYPMTLNAIVTACNQKSNRDPAMSLDEEAVWSTLEVLRAAGVVSRLLPGGSSRVERFRHEAKDFCGWEKPQRAVMAELLLRGAQTVGELRGHCARMYPFENIEAVTAVLDSLTQTGPPTVETLPRAPGQSAVRYAHRLYSPEEWAVLAQAPPDARVPAASQPAQVAGSPPADDSTALSGRAESIARQLSALRKELEDLQDEVAELHTAIADLRRRIDVVGG